MIEKTTTVADNHNERWVAPVAGVPLKRISWSAVFAGVIISMVIYLLLAILGTAIGASTIDPLKEGNPFENLGTGAAIWTGASMLIAIAAGAYASGRLAQREGALHGLLMFGVNTLICTWFIIVIANSAVSGAASVAGTGMQALGNGIGAAAPSVSQMVKDKLAENNINLDNLQNELETTLRQTGKPELQPENLQNKAEGEVNNAQNQADQAATNPQANPQAADTEVAGFINGLIQRNESTFQAADRDALKNIIKARTGKSDQEAEQIVNNAEKSYQQARQKFEELKQQAEQKAREAGEKAAAATAKASWFAFFMLIVEAILAGVMGMVGRRTQPTTVVVDQRTV